MFITVYDAEGVGSQVGGFYLIFNSNNNFVEYFPLDSSSEIHYNILSIYGKKRCADGSGIGFSPGILIGASPGDRVYSISDGQVTHMEEDETSGSSESDESKKYKYIEITQGTYKIRYHDLNATTVSQGDDISAGQSIGDIGGQNGLYLEIYETGSGEGQANPGCGDTRNTLDAVDPLRFYFSSLGYFTPELKFNPQIESYVFPDLEDQDKYPYKNNLLANYMGFGN
jgi:murein DD-endopeptidase MepM/ murein hydrolase activator NlpD